MATTVSPNTKADSIDKNSGVAPLRAGQGHEFFWRRLHSLSGIIPVGAFLLDELAHVLLAAAPREVVDEQRAVAVGVFAEGIAPLREAERANAGKSVID